MPVMLGIAATATVLGGAVSAYGQLEAGKSAREEGLLTEEQLRENAGQTRAQGQYAGEEELRKSELTMSRMLAVAAASGASVSDPTIFKLASGIATEGALASATQRYSAESAARGMEKQGIAAARTGASREKASQWAAAGSLLSSAGSAFGQYRRAG